MEGRSSLRINPRVCLGVMALRAFISKVNVGCRKQGELNPPHCQFVVPNLDRLWGLAAERFYSDHLQLLIRSLLNNKFA